MEQCFGHSIYRYQEVSHLNVRGNIWILLLIAMFASYIDSFAQTIVAQQNGRFRICKGSITDSDKASNKSDYEHNENSTLTLSIPDAKSITLKFGSFCTEKDNDVLRIFDGKDTFAPLLGTWSGNVGPGSISSSDSVITMHFKSDKSISCSGWKAQVVVQTIKPTPIKFNQSATGTSKPSCKDSVIKIATDVAIPCDSFNVSNTQITGPNSPVLSKIKALNCVNGKSTLFEMTISNRLTLNGSYKINHSHGYKDFCDSTYFLQSSFNFSITNCPILVELQSNKDTICKGDCLQLTLKVTGGDSTKYKYYWTPSSVVGKGPHTQCLTSNRKYTIKVDDGASVPGYDTLDIVVLDPPKAQQDTSVCYYSNNFLLKSSPSGGTWKGPGIVNAKTGEFKPNAVWGTVKVWYQIGSCADTVAITVNAPYNYENVFCPNKSAFPLYWYGPAGGSWTGPKVTSAGLFTPDTAGTYVVTYEWKGCKSTKTVFVQSIKVPERDTVCESVTGATLTFSPKGLYPNYFAGLTNYYTGTYNPSLMGGPKDYRIIYQAQGGCRDTTVVTVLPSDAGLNDTFCPTAGNQILKTFRPITNYTWKSKGINGVGSIYNTSWWGQGKTNIDTLILKTSKCTDYKLVHVLPTKVLSPDTLVFCQEDTTTSFAQKGVKLSVPGGKWYGFGVVKNIAFDPRVTGVGTFLVRYSTKGCDDTLVVVVRNKPFIQMDTSICLNIKQLKLFKKDNNGVFWGVGIAKNSDLFLPAVSGPGKHIVFYKSSEGCGNQVSITVDTVPKIAFSSPTYFCNKDSSFDLIAMPIGGSWIGTGVQNNTLNPKLAMSGNHRLYYSLNVNACPAKDSLQVYVDLPLSVQISPSIDSACYGDILTLEATVNGGLIAYHELKWSHGQLGNKTYYTAKQTGELIAIARDGCSDPSMDTARILVHPRIWSKTLVSDSVCRGQKGWAFVTLGNGNPVKRSWSHDPQYIGDTLFAFADNRYRVTLIDKNSGCMGDTIVEIPGYKAIQAGFSIQTQNNEKCLTPLDANTVFFNQSTGGTSGTWHWGDGTSNPFVPNQNEIHTFAGTQSSYKVMLSIRNEGNCTDTATENICYKDTVIYYLPTAFTPNGDGINDRLDCAFWGTSEIQVRIINRWGEIVFESTENNITWDGNYNGNPCMEGTYAMVIEYKGNKQGKRIAYSAVTLLRTKSQ